MQRFVSAGPAEAYLGCDDLLADGGALSAILDAEL
jgi:hypothetical protein